MPLLPLVAAAFTPVSVSPINQFPLSPTVGVTPFCTESLSAFLSSSSCNPSNEVIGILSSLCQNESNQSQNCCWVGFMPVLNHCRSVLIVCFAIFKRL